MGEMTHDEGDATTAAGEGSSTGGDPDRDLNADLDRDLNADLDRGPGHDPDGDPGNLTSGAPVQPDQAEGEDDPRETGA